jgi:hypothetical protein
LINVFDGLFVADAAAVVEEAMRRGMGLAGGLDRIGELFRIRSSRLRRTNEPQLDTQQCALDEWEAIETEDRILDSDWSRHIQSLYFSTEKHTIGSAS